MKEVKTIKSDVLGHYIITEKAIGSDFEQNSGENKLPQVGRMIGIEKVDLRGKVAVYDETYLSQKVVQEREILLEKAKQGRISEIERWNFNSRSS
jgi:hypothetical protein